MKSDSSNENKDVSNVDAGDLKEPEGSNEKEYA